MNNWVEEIKSYCEEYQIPIEYLADVLSEPKVVPMIRGKAFEFTALLALRRTLPSDEFDVVKTPMNAQSGFHDEDVVVFHKPTQTRITIECKLSAKGRFKHTKTGYQIGVKCMRSRTLGEGRVGQLAPLWGISEEQLAIHNDQYLPSNFDIVLTSLGNAFYETDEQSGKFIWSPSADAVKFLRELKGDNIDLKEFAFNRIYLARSLDLAIHEKNKITCTRKKCSDKQNCGFIPNYPLIAFDEDTAKPSYPWYSIDDCKEFMDVVVQHKLQ